MSKQREQSPSQKNTNKIPTNIFDALSDTVDDVEIPKTTIPNKQEQTPKQITQPKRTASVTITKQENVETSTITFSDNWTVWSHSFPSKEWGPSSYSQIHTIDDVFSFWQLFNNINKIDLGKTHVFIMRGGILPVWEDTENRRGGQYSIRIEPLRGCELYTSIVIYSLCGQIFRNNPALINGISIWFKSGWHLIKIWTREFVKETSPEYAKEFGILNKYLTTKFGELSIKYTQNKPEQ